MKKNADGSVEFTDRKSDEHKEIKVEKPLTYKAPNLPFVPTLSKKKLSPTFNYAIKIIQPVNDATIINITDIKVSINMSMPLKKGYGHKIRYQLSEQTMTSTETEVVFNKIHRGTHVIKVSVVDKEGDVISPIVSSQFHLKRFFKKPS